MRAAALNTVESEGVVGTSYCRIGGWSIAAAVPIELLSETQRLGPSRNREAVELETLCWVHFFNHRRPLGPIRDIQPDEAEANYYAEFHEPAVMA